MKTTAIQCKSAAAVLLMVTAIATIAGALQTDQAPPKELVLYVRDAKRRGVSEARIKQQAVTLGWSAAVVDAAIGQEGGKKSVAGGQRGDSIISSTPQSSGQLRGIQEEPGLVGPSQLADTDTPASRGVPGDYRIGSGDTLQISVWKEPEASVPSVVVRPDGKITVPLIKDVEVAGLTPQQAEKLITDGLSKFITDANVTVVVAAITSKKIYVIGAVRKEGTLPYTYGMTVMQALSEAGGLTDYAKRKKIYILRSESGREYRLDFNYEEVVKGERMEQNIILLPGDTVVIPH